MMAVPNQPLMRDPGSDLQMARAGHEGEHEDSKLGSFVAPADSAQPVRAGGQAVRARRAILELDPALLAFVKCHVTSFPRWEVLWALSEEMGRWAAPVQLARSINQPVDKIRAALDGLAGEGVIEVAESRAGFSYRLPEGEPTSVVVGRLLAQATRSPDLRRIIVTRFVQAAIARP